MGHCPKFPKQQSEENYWKSVAADVTFCYRHDETLQKLGSSSES